MKKEKGAETSGDGFQTSVLKWERYSCEKRLKTVLLKKRTSGKGFGKSVVYITGNTPGDPAQIKNQTSVDSVNDPSGQTI